MKSLMTLFLVAILMALAITLSAAAPHSSDEETPKNNYEITNRFLISQKRIRDMVQKCDMNPKICSIKGSTGPDCCKNKCVSLSNDRFNCGKCGKKCSYAKICCEGKCVNPMTNEKHCGKCGSKCNTGSSCIYGMCSYA